MRFGRALNALTYGLFQNKAPVAYSNPSTGGMFLSGGRSVTSNIEAAHSVSTLYSIIRLLSTSTAQVDWHLYKKSVDGRRKYGPEDDNRREVTRHPALNVFTKPNSMMTQQEFIERTQQHIDLAGESFWVVEKVGNIVLELWPVRPDRMQEVVSKQDGLVGWVYTEPDGTKVPFKTSEVVHIQTPDPMNPYRGLSPVNALMTTLNTVESANQYNLNFFRNSAHPSGLIKVKSSISDKDFNRLQIQWNDGYRGVRNAHRVGILDNEMQWETTSVSQRDMQFVELSNVSREVLREAYGIHPHMLGLSESVNRANAMAASADFAAYQLVPRLDRIKDALNQVLLPMFGDENVEFVYDDPVPLDSEQENKERDSKIKAVVALISAGFDPEETLEVFGLPPITYKEPEPAPTQVQAPPGEEDTQDEETEPSEDQEEELVAS